MAACDLAFAANAGCTRKAASAGIARLTARGCHDGCIMDPPLPEIRPALVVPVSMLL